MVTSFKDFADLIAELSGFKGGIVWDTNKPNNQLRWALDTTRAKEYFGFEAQMPFREGLKNTIVWYLENKLDKMIYLEAIGVSSKDKDN